MRGSDALSKLRYDDVPIAESVAVKELLEEVASKFSELDESLVRRKTLQVLAKLVKERRPDMLEVPRDGFCPVCGSPSPLGYLDSNGALWLMCPMCGATWRVHRVKCPYCSSEETWFKRDLFAPWIRVYGCDKCGHNWIVVDEKEESYPGIPREAYWLILKRYMGA
ncbi:hypothetical protein IPA_06685 [Ignicoccus pacificus DSM 13166]|uniref:Formate dehydrogenase accessory protein FdhE n=1 Tax=Ignicoccus pacificus DSM 13166 TaxID=940294 RepID=A0A977KCX2_9CREN|nr:hypothetical protein IPA_06685 [Ignicoccus pacificus DSM 13166]